MSGKGSARVNSGPPPDPNALRRDRPNDRADWTLLPSAGRRGRTPPWPLREPDEEELAMWTRLWKLPQAVAWEAGHYVDTVACYVRALYVAQAIHARAADRTIACRYQDALGLTDAGLRSNRWLIETPVQQTADVRTDGAELRTAKARFRSLPGGAASLSPR